MAYFDTTALPLILIFEGSKFTNIKEDKGGATRYGVIQVEYDFYRHNKGLPQQSVENILMPEVTDIYLNKYWLASKCDKMSDKLGVVIFDASVNNGPGRSIKFLQAAIGAKVDGVIGKETLTKLAKYDQSQLVNTTLSNREQFYKKIVERDPTQIKFLNGWLRRLTFLRDFISGAKTLEQIRQTW